VGHSRRSDCPPITSGIDRIACPWLIRRFIDPIAEFTYVPEDQVVAVARPDVTRVPKTPDLALVVGAPQVIGMLGRRERHPGGFCIGSAILTGAKKWLS
jgi:hypothetical protein